MRKGSWMLLAVAVLAAFLAVGSNAGEHAESATPTLASAVRVAKSHVVRRFEISQFHSVKATRSKRNPSWAAVAGYYRKPAGRRPNTWVVYLRVRGGRWSVVYAGIGLRAFEPKVRGVPCDIWPPFSEPSC